MNDPKFIWLAQKAKTNVASVIAVWAALLEHASQEDERGCVEGFDPESYDCALGLEDGTCFRIMEAMQVKGLLAGTKIAQWDSRQPKREREDDSSDRVARHRERQRNANVTPVTPSNALEEIRLEEKRLEKEEEGKKTPARRASALPPDFGITSDRKEYAVKTLPNVNADELMAAFRDYHSAKGTTARDWDASWRTYVRNGLKFGYPMLPAQPKQPEKVVRYDARGRLMP